MKVIQLQTNEANLIKNALKNKRDAQQVLFDMYAPKMLSVCRYYISDIQQAEAAMLNGFLKVFLNLKSFKAEGSFEGWIRRIMVREAISFLRTQKKIEFSIEEVSLPTTFSDNITSNINVAQIQRLIDQLPEGYRIVFVLYALEGYKHHEIANMLSITEGTSKSQLFKARKMLQQQIIKQNKIENGTV